MGTGQDINRVCYRSRSLGDRGGAPPGRVGHNGLASRFATGGPGRAALPAARYSATALVHTSVRRDELQRNCPTVANLLPR